ncbi:MAG: adhesin transport system membrane fusion protein [Cyclobacteriaceae bacterium]|jgi:multidrug resistance efflux pump
MLNISNDKIENILNEDQLYSLKTLKTPGLGRTLAKVLLAMTGIIMLSMFLPWQQNIHGSGTLTALSPENRPQKVETAIAGRIEHWKVVEGQLVAKGDTILSLTEIKEKYFDPNLLLRLNEQLAAKESSLDAKEMKKKALENQVVALRQALVIKLQQVKNKLKQSGLKLESDSIGFETEKINFQNAENIFERNKSRYEAGNIPLTKFQEIENKYQMSRAKFVSSENKWLQSKASLINAMVEIAGTQAEYSDKISKSQSELNATIADFYDTQGSLAKMQNELANMTIRNRQYQVLAPQTGYIVRAMKAGIGETIKEGEAICIIMPSTDDKASEMFVKAMDIPFISTGRKVRIQFDGWPALQFSGFPNVSVGTFGGIVQVIDRVDSKGGKFRILVKPDPDEDAWPEQLRMGSGIKGWVMLNNVPIWFELWRQLNGFPPSIYENGVIVMEKE